MDKGLVSFFEVNECGFYKVKQKKDNELSHGGMHESLNLIFQWLQGRDFLKTIPWDIESVPNRTKIFCKDIAYNKDSEEFLFVFWKCHSNDNGKLTGILANSKVGATSNDAVSFENSKHKGQDVIVGQPMYYWFSPKNNFLASIKFSHSLSDTERVLEYLKRCIDNRIPCDSKKEHEYTHTTPSGTTIPIKKVTYTNEKNENVSFSFKASLKESSLEASNLNGLASSITHLVVRETISTTTPDSRSSLFKIFNKIENKQRRKSREKQVEIISETKLSPAELKELVTVHQEEFKPENKWVNIGFKTDGKDGSTKWFDNYIDREYILVLSELLKDETYYSAQTIMNAVEENRDRILETLESSREDNNTLVANDG